GGRVGDRPVTPERDAGVPLVEELAAADVIVDALFGTGLTRPIEGHPAEVVRAVCAAKAPVFAVDLPSGLDADTGAVLGVAVRARVTATFAHRKLGVLTPSGARWAGKVVLVDIGVPASLPAQLGPTVTMIEPADVATWRSSRAPGAYKTSAGHVLVVGGSPGRVGAPQLTVRGAMRAGAGLATIATWPEVATAIEGQILEAMTARLSPERSGEPVDEQLKGVLAGKHAVVVGPGLGVGPEARHVVERLLAVWKGPIVVDADALTMFAGDTGPVTRLPAAIMTPHPGELSRLSGSSITEIEGDRFKAAKAAAASLGAVVVLKGAHTVVAAPDGKMAVSPVACPALATAGAGDVLGGVIAAFACSLSPFEAACAGVMVHAMAGEAWSKGHGDADRGMLASEIADAIPGLFEEVSPSRASMARR
ncbi:MAG: NAD(P)H-hydrate dehydratase, partial [Polyangiaceae bacterium]